MEKINIGILGTADIAPRALIEPSKDMDKIIVYGISSRNIEKAKKFAQTYNIPNVFSGYDSILECDEINAVYIPLINSLHTEWIIKAAEAHKHILVEKPICMSKNDSKKIEDAVNRNSVQILEGMMVQFHPWQKKMKELIENQVYGKLKSIKTHANYKLEDIKSFRLDPERGGGVFFEEGILWCQLTQLCLGLNPVSFKCKSAFDGPKGVDKNFEARMDFPNGVYTELQCSYELPYEANHWFEFERANLKIRNFWRPTFGQVKMKIDISYLETDENDSIVFPPRNYYFDQLEFFVKVLRGIEENVPLKQSLERVKIMEKIYCTAKNKN